MININMWACAHKHLGLKELIATAKVVMYEMNDHKSVPIFNLAWNTTYNENVTAGNLYPIVGARRRRLRHKMFYSENDLR